MKARNRLIIISITLSVVVVMLGAFLVQRSNQGTAFGFLELFMTFAIGVLGNVLAASWFIWMFQHNDSSRLDEIYRFCQVFYQRGIWVYPKRGRLKNSYYEEKYSNALEVDILGIANKGFMKSFYSGYAEEDFNLNKVVDKLLFKKLQTIESFRVTVLFLDPKSSYAKIRNRESDNRRTIEELNQIVEALTKIQEAYERDKAPGKNGWRLKGSLEFKMFKDNPHTSIFHVASQENKEKSIMVIGLLPENRSGDDSPSVVFHQQGDYADLFESYLYHLHEIEKKSELFLRWDEQGITCSKKCGRIRTEEREAPMS
jgi:hypothetical protein